MNPFYCPNGTILRFFGPEACPGFIMALTFRQGKSLSNKINTHTVKLTVCSSAQLLLLRQQALWFHKVQTRFDFCICDCVYLRYRVCYIRLLLPESCRNRFDDIMMAAESMRHSLRFTSHYDYRDHQSPEYTVNNFYYYLISLQTFLEKKM